MSADASIPANDAAPARALVSPSADFWLMGAASGVAFVIFIFLTDVLKIDLQDKPYYWAFYLSFLFNDPHFMFSYLLFYKGFVRRAFGMDTPVLSRLRNLVAGIVAPAALGVFFVIALDTGDPDFVRWGWSAMLFSVGWHYVKQGYGVLITLSLYEGVLYTALEKRILWVNAYAIWLCSWIRSNGVVTQQQYRITGMFVDMPDWLGPACFDIACLTSLAAVLVLLKHWLWDGKGISANAVTGYAVAVYMWILMPFVSVTFYAIIPLFHSLQYLPFVYKFKHSEFRRVWPEASDKAGRKKALRRAAGFALAGFALGVTFFELVPKSLDRVATAHELGLHADFFFLMFLVIINIHHYFMDSAFWRRDNATVQENLFRA